MNKKEVTTEMEAGRDKWKRKHFMLTSEMMMMSIFTVYKAHMRTYWERKILFCTYQESNLCIETSLPLVHQHESQKVPSK